VRGRPGTALSLRDDVGLPIQESLPLLVDTRVKYGLRERIRVIASGKRMNPGEVAWALCVGADFVNSARGFLFALGGIQSMQCDKNTGPTGITTHPPRLQRGLDPEDQAERVRHYVENLRHEVAIIAQACGVADPRRLQREQGRIVVGPGRSEPLSALYRREGTLEV
jgi:glutamate synthase domain-containing protein 2